MAYTKLDAGLTDSTIWQAPDTTRIVWITMLAMADQNGYVGASMPGLAGRARVSLEACIAAVETFLAPDPWSRTKDHDGRRIAEAEGGWQMFNHAKYRAAQNAEDRRERSRIAMANLRAKRKQDATTANGYPELTKLTQAEAEAETKRIGRAESIRPADGARSPGDNSESATPAGLACLAMRKAGMSATNPGDPRLIALCEQGATVEEFAGLAAEAVSKGKGFAWALATLQARRAEAHAIALAPKATEVAANAEAERSAAYLREQAEHAARAKAEAAERRARKAQA